MRAEEAMTVQRTANKTLLLLLLALVTASWIWSRYYQAMNPAVVTPWMAGGGHRRAHRGPGHHLQTDLGPH